ncbi:MIR domain protein [Ichthyophthirius multifiliis]|uniref:MIR domain protein n=1 Tax=Ichthyophthirius multifiliis TaxID=5932 RepID=G0R3P2_ICHMU|nr:MIR domain protein [Ichthyophthirius multifiliis]EGR27925.1 MIR domain protein [Ichthyophthirius multifiliis]|eukprot:XP_004027270.1 MIR domain protein [Ichthyophthirius multifiliis]
MSEYKSDEQQGNKKYDRNVLHFGATVYLCYEDETGQEYYISAQGFTKDKIILKKETEMKKNGNYQKALFKLYPQFYYNEYLKNKNKYYQKKQVEKTQKNISLLDKKSARLNIPKEIKSMEEEVLLNYDQYKKLIGTPILFGSTIQLLHYNSNKYLYFDFNNISEVESDNLKCVLRDEYCNETSFCFEPGFLFQQESKGFIFDQDTVYITSIIDSITSSGTPYLHASKKTVQNGKKKQKREVNISTNKKTQWKIKVFCEYNDERQGLLQICDIIWINYSEQDLNLIAKQTDQKQNSYMLKFEGCDSTEKYKKFIGNTNGMFVIENDNMQNGGLVEWDNSYKFRHLTTNFNIEEDYWFKTAETAQHDYNTNTKIDTKADFDDDFIQNLIQPQFSTKKKEEYVFKLAKANLNEVRMTQFLLECKKTIQKVYKYLTPEFIKDIKAVKFEQEFYLFLSKTQKLESCLIQLHLFCYNKLLSYLYRDQDYGEINQFIQNILREQYFIELLTLILANSFPKLEHLKEIQQTMEKAQNEKQNYELQIKKEFIQIKQKICTLIYKVICSICSNNQRNQQRAANFLPLIAMQSQYIEGGMECIKSIILDFEELLYQLHNLNGQVEKKKGLQQVIIQTKRLKILQIIEQEEKYRYKYEKITQQLKNLNFKIKEQWDIIDFYCYLLIKNNKFEIKRKLLSFLATAATYRQCGINVNQELIYKYLIPKNEEQVYEDNYFIRIKSDGPTLIVFVNSEQRKLVDIVNQKNFHQIGKKNIDVAQKQDNLQKINLYILIYIIFIYLRLQNDYIKSDTEILNFISDQIQFYASMCNNRNNTWKKFVENSCNFYALVETITDQKFNYEIRSIICQLLNKLFLDQEPKRIQYVPELCKILKNEQDLQDYDAINQQEKDFIDQIQAKILQYIQQKSEIVEQMQKIVEGENSKNNESNCKLVQQKSEDIYNNLTFEIMKLFRLLIDFGKYNIHQELKNFKQQQNNNNNESKIIPQDQFFKNISSMMNIFEFDKVFPEARNILILKRQQKQSGQNKYQEQGKKLFQNMTGLMGKAFSIINIFSVFQQEDQSKKKKKSQTNQEGAIADEINQADSFLKQADVLKKIILKQNSDSQNTHYFNIKKEMCDILKQYLNYQQDFMLNRLKQQFFQIVQQNDLIRKIQSENQEDKQQAFNDFKQTIKNNINAFLPSVLMTGTSVDEKEEFQKQFISYCLDKNNQKGNEVPNFNQILGYEVFPYLILMFCFTQNFQMEKQVLNIITRFYNQRQEFATLTSQMLILFDDDNQKVFEFCKMKIKSLSKNIDESETWINDLKERKNMVILDQTIKDFKFLSQILMQGSNLIVHEDKKSYNIELLYDNQQVNIIRQQMQNHLKTYLLAINLIKDSIYLVAQNCNLKLQHLYFEQLKQLFQACFQFLKNFVKQNLTNQNILSNYLISLAQALPLDIGLNELYCEIFRNNKKICTEKQKELMRHYIDLITQNGRQAKYLEFFIIIQKVNDEHILQNQKLVLNSFLDQKQRTYLLYLNDSNIKKYTNKQQKFSYIYHNEKDEPYFYHAKLIEMLSLTAAGKEGTYMNEQKLKQNLSLKYVFQLLREKDDLSENQGLDEEVEEEANQKINQILNFDNNNFDDSDEEENNQIEKTNDYFKGITQMKIPLLNYIYSTFLETEKVSDEFTRYVKDFVIFLRCENQRILTHNNYSDLYYQYLNQLLNILCAYKRIFNIEAENNLKQEKEQQQQQDTYNISQELLHVVEAIQASKLMFVNDSYYIEKKSQNKTSISPTLYETYQQRWIFFKTLVSGNRAQALKMEQTQEQIKAKAREQQYQKQISSIKKKNTDKYSQAGFKEDQIWQKLWHVFLDNFLNSEDLKTLIDAEHIIFAEALDNVDKLFKKTQIVNQIVTKKEIFKKLINFLIKAHNLDDQIETSKLILIILGNFIQIKTEEIQKEDNEEKRQEMETEQIENNQNFLNQNNATLMLLNLLSDYSNPQYSDLIFGDLIQFGIKLLEGGNREIQKSFYAYFMCYTSSEVLFKRLHTQISEQITMLKQNIVDTNNLNLYLFQEKDDIILSILQFLQLLAEGHYLELQRYMKFQTKNYHNFDLIEVIIELLNQYFKKKQIIFVKNMTQCFDTLTEYIQGPCIENQYALIQDNFLDLASNLLAIDEIIDDINLQIKKKKRKVQQDQKQQIQKVEQIDKNKVQEDAEDEPFPKWEIAKLKYKCSITLISLLEARQKNGDITSRMMKTLNIDIIKRNIVDIYHQFIDINNGIYDSNIFNHNELKVDLNDQEQLNKCSFIIETGFNLFILLNIFKEDTQQEEASYMKKKRKIIGPDDSKNMLKDNIVSKLIDLVFSFAKGLKQMVEEQANRVQQMVKNKVQDDLELKKIKQRQIREKLMDQAFKFFSQNTLHIEILREETNQLEKTYFYCPYFCKDLDKETKNKFNMNANRISVKGKVTSLIQESQDLIKVMKHNYSMNKWLKQISILHILSQQINLLRDVAFILAILINFLVLFSYEQDEEGNQSVKLLMYAFTLIGYYFLNESYPSNFCESTFICLLTAFDRSFKSDGGLGGYLNHENQEDLSTSYFLGRFFFDNIFMILLMVIMLNIVAGIIIDQFGELRDTLKSYNEDLQNKCFICGFSREQIEKDSNQNQNFKSHIKDDHYMWNYLYYISYISDKKTTEYTGIESYVYNKLQKEEITWFPSGRALCMNKNDDEKSEKDVIYKLKNIIEKQEEIDEQFDNACQLIEKIQMNQIIIKKEDIKLKSKSENEQIEYEDEAERQQNK